MKSSQKVFFKSITMMLSLVVFVIICAGIAAADENIVLIQNSDAKEKLSIVPVAYSVNGVYKEINFDLPEKEARKKNAALFKALSKKSKYDIVSDAGLIGQFKVSKVTYGRGIACGESFQVFGDAKLNSQKNISKDRVLYLNSYNDRKVYKVAVNKQDKRFPDLKSGAVKQVIANHKPLIKPANINNRKTMMKKIKGFGLSNATNPDIIIAEVDVHLKKRISMEVVGDIDEFKVVLVGLVTKNGVNLFHIGEWTNVYGIADIDGDNNIEIVLKVHGGGEVGHFEVYRITDQGVKKVYSGTEYGC
jgi:hypothetical protein